MEAAEYFSEDTESDDDEDDCDNTSSPLFVQPPSFPVYNAGGG